MSRAHPSHSWGNTFHCHNCGCSFYGLVSETKCVPQIDERQEETAPAREIDWSKLNAEFSA